jgi:hypothetical protein
MKQSTAYEYLVSIVTKVNTNVCVVWPFYTNKKGYGLVRMPCSIVGEKPLVAAHRLAYKVAYGEWPMPQGMHSCDNPGCFNPRHISPGTVKDNSDDMVAKGRQARGERFSFSKLTEELVAQMRREYVGGLTCKQLAARYGVDGNTAHLAVSGRTWKHVPNPVKMRSGRTPLVTQCLHGHPFIEGNLYTRRLPSGRTFRQCKTCAKNRSKEHLKRGK